MIPEELLKCSEKELIKILDKKNVFASKYLSSLTSDSNIYINGGIHLNKFFYRRTDVNDWRTIKVPAVKDTFKPLSLIDFKDLKRKLIYDSVNNWTFDKFFDFIYDKTVSYYGDEFVDKNVSNQEITIHFPELTITNSVEQSHIMRGLYLVLEIRSDSVRLNRLYRTTYTQEEVSVGYMFSHCASRNLNRYSSTFCFGRSNPVSKIMDNMTFDRSRIFKNIDMFLPIIQEYLSWESIEGVPYQRIDSVINSKCKYEIKNTPLYSKEGILTTISNKLSDFKYSYVLNNDNVYIVKLDESTLTNINRILTEDYPNLCFKNLNGQSVIDKEPDNSVYSQYEGSVVLNFKGEDKTFTILPFKPDEDTLPIEIHTDILKEISNYLEFKFNTFLINKYTYE